MDTLTLADTLTLTDSLLAPKFLPLYLSKLVGLIHIKRHFKLVESFIRSVGYPLM